MTNKIQLAPQQASCTADTSYLPSTSTCYVFHWHSCPPMCSVHSVQVACLPDTLQLVEHTVWFYTGCKHRDHRSIWID
jgi:hypothetical protein